MRTQKWFRVVAVSLTVLGSAPASAQPAQPAAPVGETSAMTDKARELFIEGGKAAARGRWAEAHAAWLAAWGLKQHYQIAGNLGAAEVELKRYREAAGHLSFYMREAPKEKVKERMKAEALHVEARKHVGALSIKVEPTGAEVFVDGRSVGTAPLLDEVFVEAGPRMIEARLNGYEVSNATVDAVLGTSRPVALTLVKSAATSGAAGAGGAGGADGSGGAATGGAGGTTDSTPRTREDTGGANKAVIGVGIGAGVLAVGTGIVLTAMSSSKGSDAEALWTELDRDQVLCPAAAYAWKCDELKNLRAGRDGFANAALWSFVLGGAFGAGTLIYALAAPASKPKAKKEGVSRVHALPLATVGGGGLLITGAW